MALLETRKVQRNTRYGKYGLTLPIVWVRTIERTYGGQKPRGVMMRERGDFLLIEPAFSSTGSKEWQPDQPEDLDYSSGVLMERGEIRGVVRAPPFVEIMQDGRKQNCVVRKIYKVGKHARVIPLHEEWIERMQRKAHKRLYFVKVYIYDTHIFLRPVFLNLPYRRNRKPPKAKAPNEAPRR